MHYKKHVCLELFCICIKQPVWVELATALGGSERSFQSPSLLVDIFFFWYFEIVMT
jgi:hypothetical protein